jgi:hypothetical protein
MKQRTIPINHNPDFRALEAHADARLTAKPDPLKLEPRKGSTSWTDPNVVPADAAVKYKLMMFKEGIFFGVREEWANDLGISLASIGSDSRAPLPSDVEFCGAFVKNDAAGRRKIDSIIALFP